MQVLLLDKELRTLDETVQVTPELREGRYQAELTLLDTRGGSASVSLVFSISGRLIEPPFTTLTPVPPVRPPIGVPIAPAPPVGVFTPPPPVVAPPPPPEPPPLRTPRPRRRRPPQ